MTVGIYSLIGCPAPGELGDKTKFTQPEVCPKCKRRKPIEYLFIEYRFDQWEGEDMVTALGQYAVSDRLYRALQGAHLTGMAFRKMAVSKGDDFYIDPEAYSTELPTFHHLVVTGEAAGPEIWYTSWTCPVCHVRHWDQTAEGTIAATAELTGKLPKPRQVFRRSWKNDDIFSLGDPGVPVLTGRFKEVLERIGVRGILLQPAEWVD